MKEAVLRDSNTGKVYYFDNDFKNMHIPSANLIPVLGVNKFDGHIFVSGATGSGKSWLIRDIVKSDPKNRNVILFSDVRNDPSLKGIKKLHHYPHQVNLDWVAKNMKNSIMIFDDITDRDQLLFRNRVLEKGRHKKITAICVNHKLRDHNLTKFMLNECRYVCVFPSSNRGAVMRFLGTWMEVPKHKRLEMVDQAMKDGRHMIFHMFHPNVVASAKSVYWL